MLLFIGCLTPQQNSRVSREQICSDNCTYCLTEIEVADQTFDLSQSQHTDNCPIGPSADPITPGAWRCSHWSRSLIWPDLEKASQWKGELSPGVPLEADTLTTMSMRLTPWPLGHWGWHLDHYVHEADTLTTRSMKLTPWPLGHWGWHLDH